MKVALVTLFPRDPGGVCGGVTGAAKYLADELVKAGLSVTVVVPPEGDGPVRREERDGLTILRAGRRGFWKFLPGTLYDLVSGRRQINEILADVAPDIVHYQGAALLAASSRYPSVLTIHGLVERDAWFDRRWGPLRLLRWLLLSLTEARARDRAGDVVLVSGYAGSTLKGPRRAWRVDNPIADSFFAVARRPAACCAAAAFSRSRTFPD